MEEIKDKVIVLQSKERKESDRIITLFSLNKGVLNANLKGVNNPKAKLKFLAQPFCFAEVTLLKKNGFLIVTNAYAIESFFSLTSDYNCYQHACGILEVLKTFSLNESAYPEIFVAALKSFKIMEFDKATPEIALIKFMLEVFKTAGYGFTFNKCSNCMGTVLTEPYFDLDSGNILCLSCKNNYSVKISAGGLTALKIITNTDFEKINSLKLKQGDLKEILTLLKKVYLCKFQTEIKSF